MSMKVPAFTAVIHAPLTRRDFTMIWEAVPQCMLTVQSASYPGGESYAETSVPWLGTQISIPTRVYSGGDWKFEVPDNTLTSVRYELNRIYMEQELHSIILIQGTAFNSLNFSNVPAAVGSILNAGSAGASALLTGCRLGDAYIKSIDPVDMQNGTGSGDAILWRVTVHYSYIDKLTSRA